MPETVRVRHTCVTRLESIVTISELISILGFNMYISTIMIVENITMGQGTTTTEIHVSRLFHFVELLFCDNVSVGRFDNFFTQGQDS